MSLRQFWRVLEQISGKAMSAIEARSQKSFFEKSHFCSLAVTLRRLSSQGIEPVYEPDKRSQ
jgi:hypothetical protein